MPHQPINELAHLLHDHTHRTARRALSDQVDDIGTVVRSGDEVLIRLHQSGQILPEDAFYFSSNCQPQALHTGDAVLIIVVANEHWVVDRGALGSDARGQTVAATESD